VISIYQRRWPIEIIFKELKSALGSGELGEHQALKEEKRIKNSIGTAIISCLFLPTVCKEDINQGQSWGIFNLQEKFRIKVMTNQIKHSMNLEIEKLQQAA
jgi:IS4 transposase